MTRQGRDDSSRGRGQLRRGIRRILNFTKASFDPRGTLSARAPTDNNKTFNRVPRGIRSRTHTVYHADADNYDQEPGH